MPDDSISSEPKILAHHISLTRYHMPAPVDSTSTTKEKTESPKESSKKSKAQEDIITLEEPKEEEFQSPQSAMEKRKERIQKRKKGN